jgi:hypothetical protein
VSLLAKRPILAIEEENKIDQIISTNHNGSCSLPNSQANMLNSLNSLTSSHYNSQSLNNNGKSYNLNVNANPYAQNGQKRITHRFKLITEGEVQICKLQHSKNMFNKLLNSKLLRRWKTQRIILTDKDISPSMVISKFYMFKMLRKFSSCVIVFYYYCFYSISKRK